MSTGSNNGRGRTGRSSARTNLPLKFEITSSFAEGREVQKRITDDVERLGFDSHSQFAIKLALEEALINAIKHGNKLDPKKKVKIEALVRSVPRPFIAGITRTGVRIMATPESQG